MCSKNGLYKAGRQIFIKNIAIHIGRTKLSFTKAYRWVTKFKLKQDAAYPGHPAINNNDQQKT